MVVLENMEMDLEKIAASGQCFRMVPKGQGRFELAAHGRLLKMEQQGNRIVLQCTRRQYEAIWRGYFDIDRDYSAIRAMVDPQDAFLMQAAEYGKGVRILKQDPWEMLITFIISQRKSIPAIQKSVEALCAMAGKPLQGAEGLRAFPTARALAALTPEQLAACSLGYRAPYIHKTARLAASGKLNMKKLAELEDEALMEALVALPGVGVKVASCVMLFGYQRLRGFPVDVWIDRIIEKEYGGCFPLEKYRGAEGVIQQYMFFYGRSESYGKHSGE